MKIHATRIAAPTAEHAHGTKWQVAVTFTTGRVLTFDSVVVEGRSVLRALPESVSSEVQPRVWCEPDSGVRVFGCDHVPGRLVQLDTLDDSNAGT